MDVDRTFSLDDQRRFSGLLSAERRSAARRFRWRRSKRSCSSPQSSTASPRPAFGSWTVRRRSGAAPPDAAHPRTRAPPPSRRTSGGRSGSTPRSMPTASPPPPAAGRTAHAAGHHRPCQMPTSSNRITIPASMTSPHRSKHRCADHSFLDERGRRRRRTAARARSSTAHASLLPVARRLSCTQYRSPSCSPPRASSESRRPASAPSLSAGHPAPPPGAQTRQPTPRSPTALQQAQPSAARSSQAWPTPRPTLAGTLKTLPPSAAARAAAHGRRCAHDQRQQARRTAHPRRQQQQGPRQATRRAIVASSRP